MQKFKNINIPKFEEISNYDNSIVIDIRDQASFSEKHIPNAEHFSSEKIMNLVETKNKDAHLLIYCYKGNSSQKVAHFLSEFGFKNVYSLIGGFNLWKNQIK